MTNSTRATKRWLLTAAAVGAASLCAPRVDAQSTPFENAPSHGVSAAPAFALGTTLDALRSREVILARFDSDGTSVRTGYAAAIVRRPIAQIVAAIHDVNHYRDFIPQFEQSQELGRGNATQDLFVRIAVSHFAHLWARLRYRDVALEHGVVMISGRALQGNVQRMDVRWRATPIDGGTATVLEFWSLVVPLFPIPIPASVLDGEQESAARRGVEAVRLRVENEPVASASIGSLAPQRSTPDERTE